VTKYFALLAAVASLAAAQSKMDHVLMVSADGLHAVDVARYVQAKPQSTLAQ
jgi:hypothetical protein